MPTTQLPTTQSGPTHTRTPDLTRPDTVRPTYAAEATQRSMLPTPTPISLGTPIPETAIEKPLSESGPWLLYRAAAYPYTWFVINADGTGRTEIKFPKALDDTEVFPCQNSDYLAIRQSSSDPIEDRITILHLPEMKIVETIDLISYPSLLKSDAFHAEYTGAKFALWYEDPVWSPDGRYLAFIGAMEGPSADVYVYDTRQDQVQRLTSNENHAVHLKWSPDSLWIAHSEAMRFEAGCIDLVTWAASADGNSVRKLYEPKCDHILTWLGSSSFLSTNRDMNGDRDLRYVDLQEGSVTTLFEGLFTTVAFDPFRAFVLIDPISDAPDTADYPRGIYILSPEDPEVNFLETEFKNWRWNTDLERIVSEEVACDEGTIASLKQDGFHECTTYSKPPVDLLWSPSGEWGIPKKTKHQIYDENYTLIRTFMNSRAEKFLWSPDSTGLFLIASGQLVYFELPDGDLQMIDNRYPSDLSWFGVD